MDLALKLNDTRLRLDDEEGAEQLEDESGDNSDDDGSEKKKKGTSAAAGRAIRVSVCGKRTKRSAGPGDKKGADKYAGSKAVRGGAKLRIRQKASTKHFKHKGKKGFLGLENKI